jgi:hypothetical protein
MAEFEMEPGKPYTASWRAKLFSLSEDGQWTDVGTGQVYIENSTIYMTNEENLEEILLQHNIAEELYKKQGETILTWQDCLFNNYSLSF